MAVSFGRLCDLSDGRFWWVTRSQWRLVLLGYEIAKTVGIVSFRMAVGFGGLRDLNDGRFSVSVVFLLRDFKDGWFAFVKSFQRR